VERKLLQILDHPRESPYGNPIPGLEELGDLAAAPFLTGVTNLVAFANGETEPKIAVIRRLAEPVQFDPELLSQLKQSGVMPGAKASISAAGSYVVVQVDGFGDGLELPSEVAGHIFVEA
jgi:DtxR family Mn-dependent transcriptional regulator